MQNKKINKVIATAITTAVLVSPITITAHAMEKSDSKSTSIEMDKSQLSNEDVKELEGKYDLKRCEIPEGVTPIVVNSEEELDKVMSEIDKVGETNQGNPLLRASRSAKFSKKVGMANFNVYADLDVANGKIKKVISKGQSLTGYTLGLSLTKGTTTCTVSSDKKSATLKARGTVNTYLLVSGVGQIASRDHVVSGTYRI